MTRTEADRALARSKLDLVVDLDAAKPVLRFHPNQDNARLARLVVTDVMQRAAGRSDPVVLAEALVTERGSRYIDFLLPGLIGLNLMGGSMWGVGYNLVVARKRRLLRRYAVTPMRRTHFLLSYFFSRSLFFTAELGVLLAFGALVFGTHVRGSYLAFGVLAYVGAAAFAGISLLIGSRVSSSEVANGWMNVVQLPMWLLSGAFFSYERFPEWLHGAIRLLPLTALVDSLRAVANEGASITQCWSELLTMGAWGAAGFVVALRTFRWQ
jgi:ABC-type multidrug transport system permease subunit